MAPEVGRGGVGPEVRRRQWPALLWGVLLLAPGAAGGVPMSGYLEYTGRHARSDVARSAGDTETHVGTLRLDGRTALWEPWLAHLRAGVGLSVSRTEIRPDNEPARQSTGRLRTGDLELNVLPGSRFPLRAWAERRDSRLNDDDALLNVLGADRTVTRYGLLQQYRNLNGGRVRFWIEETRLKESGRDDRTDERFEWNFSAAQSWISHDLSVDLNQDRTQQREADRLIDRRTLAARHRYASPEGNVTVSNLASRVARDARTRSVSSGFTQGQFASTGFWRSPGDRPLLATGSLRLVDTRAEFDDRNIDDRMADVAVGLSYRPSWHWRLDANSGVNLRDTDAGEEFSHRHLLTADYTSITRRLLGMDHRWDANTRLGHRGSDAEEDATDATLGIGQTLDRQLAQGRWGNLHATLQQSAAHTWSSVDDARVDLLNGAFLYWSHGAGDTAAFGQLQASDARQFVAGHRDRVFQLANLQLSVQQQFDRLKSLSGSAYFQASRSGDEGDMGSWQPSTHVALTYTHQHFAGVQRLRLRSDLRYYSDDVLGMLRREEDLVERETIRWENRLDYSIGLLDVLLLVVLTEGEQSRNQLYMLRVRRRFGY